MNKDKNGKVSKKQQAHVNKYIKNNYWRPNNVMPKEFGEIVKMCAAARNESVSAFIRHAVEFRIAQDAETLFPDPDEHQIVENFINRKNGN